MHSFHDQFIAGVSILYEKDAHIAENGALVAYSGVKTGRSPKDKRVVKQSTSEDDLWCSTVNIPLDQRAFAMNRERARDYLDSRGRLYCFDGFAGWDPKGQITAATRWRRWQRMRQVCARRGARPVSNRDWYGQRSAKRCLLRESRPSGKALL